MCGSEWIVDYPESHFRNAHPSCRRCHYFDHIKAMDILRSTQSTLSAAKSVSEYVPKIETLSLERPVLEKAFTHLVGDSAIVANRLFQCLSCVYVYGGCHWHHGAALLLVSFEHRR